MYRSTETHGDAAAGADPRARRQSAARALRRTVFGAAAILATLAAHAAVGYPLAFTPVAPLVWFGVLGLAAMPTTSLRPYLRRRPAVTWTLLLTLQAIVHVVGHAAPWALGLAPHAHRGTVTWAAIGVHLLAGLVLGALIAHGDRWLARALAAARAIVAESRGPRAVSGWLRIRWRARPRPARSRLAPPRPARGPPVPV